MKNNRADIDAPEDAEVEAVIAEETGVVPEAEYTEEYVDEELVETEE